MHFFPSNFLFGDVPVAWNNVQGVGLTKRLTTSPSVVLKAIPPVPRENSAEADDIAVNAAACTALLGQPQNDGRATWAAEGGGASPPRHLRQRHHLHQRSWWLGWSGGAMPAVALEEGG